MQDRVFSLTLHAHDAAWPPVQGTPLRAPGGMDAVMVATPGELAVHARLLDRPRADVRWAVDKLRRNLAALLSWGPVKLRGEAGVDEDTLLTVALDLHNASGGRVELVGRPELDAVRARVGAAEDLYRAWVDEDPESRTSLAIARDIERWGAGRGDVAVEVLDEAALAARGLRLLLAVGGASQTSPPRLVLARHTPPHIRADRRAAARKPWMLVGKGITFDSGGINVKPYESFVSMMKNDMGGAALAWALFRAGVEAGTWDRPISLVIPTCENPVGVGAMKPGAVIEAYDGTKVRVDHTDAEGRLILADALAFATAREDVERVLTFATLTTAALIAYGPYATPVHFPSGDLQGRLEAASQRTGEDLHFSPRRIWHDEANDDEIADVRNTGRLPAHASRGAGSRNAAHFLRRFSKAPLTHLDIFATTWNWAGDAPGAGPGATGAPLRTLLVALGLV